MMETQNVLVVGKFCSPKQSHAHKEGRNRTPKNVEPMFHHMAVENNTNLKKAHVWKKTKLTNNGAQPNLLVGNLKNGL